MKNQILEQVLTKKLKPNAANVRNHLPIDWSKQYRALGLSAS
jgi:hypothetical protein